MEHILEQLGTIANLLPTDAVLARTLIRNRFLDADCVLEAARAAAEDPDEGVLERLISSGHLHPGRAREIEQALERKLRERCVATDEEPVKRDHSMRWPTPFAKGPRVWRPRDHQTHENSALILRDALRKERARRRRAAIEAAGSLEEKLTRSEAVRAELDARLVEAGSWKQRLELSEGLVCELRRELAAVKEEHEALHVEYDELREQHAKLKKRRTASRGKPRIAKRVRKRAA